MMRRHTLGVLLAAVVLGLASERTDAYIEVPYALGRLVQESTGIALLRAEKVDTERNAIIYSKVADIKGKTPQATVKHNIAKAGFHPREWQTIMQIVQPGKMALFFHNGGASETCIDGYWYQCYPGGEWWNLNHAEPYLLRSYAGKADKLAAYVTEMLAGKEVVIPCMVDGDKNALQLRTAKIQRMKASLKLQDYNAKRDFVGWGGEELRRITNMAGFMQQGEIGRVDPGAGGVASADVNADGQPDLCLWGEEKVSVLLNGGNTYEPMALPYSGGARSASFGDHNGDGKPDLLLATPKGLKLLTNDGGKFRDDSPALPQERYYNLSSAAFIDCDGDGRLDVLAANGFLGLRLYRHLGDKAKGPQLFEDVSDSAGLGTWGIGSQARGGQLAVADVNGDGRHDVLYAAGNALLLLNSGGKFTEAGDSGISGSAGRRFSFGDFDGDGRPDLLVTDGVAVKLLRNAGNGKFADVTASAGDLAKFDGQAACAVFADFHNGKRLDLLVGCTKGPNRCYRNNGNSTFTESTEQIGLHRKVFNTRALCAVDLNKDGIPDLALTNEGQESAVLLSAADRLQKP